MDDYCGIDYDSTWPATAPASGSGHVANPTIQHANAAVAMFARGVAAGVGRRLAAPGPCCLREMSADAMKNVTAAQGFA